MAKKKFSRWRFPNERYSEAIIKSLRVMLSEPSGYHKGARLRGKPGLLPHQRQAFIQIKATAQA